MNIKVKKRNGKLEPIDLEKIHKVINWASGSHNEYPALNVSVSEVEMKAHLNFYDGISTQEIHEALIKSAADLISVNEPDYQYLAARLSLFNIRKKAFGDFTPPTIKEVIQRNVSLGRYDKSLATDYSDAELLELNEYINHDRDFRIAYAGMQQLEGKYLVQDRVTGQLFDTPQFIYMLVPMCLHADKEDRIYQIKRAYDAFSTQKLSLPTPIMSGIRTPTRQFSSCVLIECGDSLDSINATSSAIVKYVSQRAGIGVNAGAIRGIGSPIRGGEALHTGVIPFYKHFQTAVKSCSQGGVRGGAASVFYPIWHLEVESLLVLKNNKGIDENRVRHLDYGVQFNGLMYQRLIKGGNITLFSPNDVDGLYDAFFADQKEFERLYTQYENDLSIRKKTVKASELFSSFATERSNTGRIYLQNVDHCNTHSPFNPKVAPVKQSNLCLEIALPTKPLKHAYDPEGEIALCTLAAFNLGAIVSMDELEELSEIIVLALDSLLDYQDYPLPAAEKNKKRRTLGVGVINYAYFLAKNGAKYSDGSANDLTHKAFEAIQFYLLKASMNLAKEQGACEYFNETNYSQGILPIDTYRKTVDTITSQKLLLDWEWLRGEIIRNGLRNSTLTALMPSETSSQVSNATNGIEPPRGLLSTKSSKDGILNQLVPEVNDLGQNYELLWSIPSNQGYLELVAIMQKFVDQAISANTNYDPDKFEGGKVPMKVILKDILTAYKLGIKTLYYHNTRDGAGEEVEKEDDGCAGGACKI